MTIARKKPMRPQAYRSVWQRLAHHHPDWFFGAILLGSAMFLYALALLYALN